MQYQVRPIGQPWQDKTEDTISRFCVDRCGGGWTTAQTAEATAMLKSIRAGKTWRGHSIEIRALSGYMEA